MELRLPIEFGQKWGIRLLETITKLIWNLEKTEIIQLQTVSRDITHRIPRVTGRRN